MQLEYYGTKRVAARPMHRDGQDGYEVTYEHGYTSWSPRDVFEKAYQPLYAMSFGHAIEAMKAGSAVTRAGWNGTGMFIVLMPPLQLPPFNTQGTDRKVNDRTAKWIGEDAPLDCQPYFAMYTAKKQWQPGWLASQADMLANDWQIFDRDRVHVGV